MPAARCSHLLVAACWMLFASMMASQEPVPPTKAATIIYKNAQYDFCFTLPASWRGYTVLTDQWKGQWVGDASSPNAGKSFDGPSISIRHPKWTADAPREDIPVMIFTPVQWALVASGDVGVSAAPIGPSELGRNEKYVFALPPRYDFDEKEGVDEVRDLMNDHPLRAPCEHESNRK